MCLSNLMNAKMLSSVKHCLDNSMLTEELVILFDMASCFHLGSDPLYLLHLLQEALSSAGLAPVPVSPSLNHRRALHWSILLPCPGRAQGEPARLPSSGLSLHLLPAYMSLRFSPSLDWVPLEG